MIQAKMHEFRVERIRESLATLAECGGTEPRVQRSDSRTHAAIMLLVNGRMTFRAAAMAVGVSFPALSQAITILHRKADRLRKDRQEAEELISDIEQIRSQLGSINYATVADWYGIPYARASELMSNAFALQHNKRASSSGR